MHLIYLPSVVSRNLDLMESDYQAAKRQSENEKSISLSLSDESEGLAGFTREGMS